jgi:hypothetical protein
MITQKKGFTLSKFSQRNINLSTKWKNIPISYVTNGRLFICSLYQPIRKFQATISVNRQSI